ASQGGRVGGVQLGQEPVGDQLVVDVAHVLDLDLARGGSGRSFEASDHLGKELVESAPVLGAHVPRGPRVFGDDVGSVASLHDDSVDLVGRVELLSEGRDVHVRLDGGIEGIDALLGIGRSVSGLTVEVDVDVGDGDHVGVDYVAR